MPAAPFKKDYVQTEQSTGREASDENVFGGADWRKGGDDFATGGYARLHHFNSPLWKEYFQQLEVVSDRFKTLVWDINSDGYGWPLDPLHTWSRVWEYPFVAAHVARLCHAKRDGIEISTTAPVRPKVLDVGAAVTFFSAYLARQWVELTNFDYDQSMPSRFEWAFSRTCTEMTLGEMPKYLVGDARDTKLPAESYDGVLCISVLEHIPSWERALSELVRLLRPGGWLILTFDVQYKAPAEGLSPEDAGRLLDYLNGSLQPISEQRREIPPDVLHMYNSRYSVKGAAGTSGN